MKNALWILLSTSLFCVALSGTRAEASKPICPGGSCHVTVQNGTGDGEASFTDRDEAQICYLIAMTAPVARKRFEAVAQAVQAKLDSLGKKFKVIVPLEVEEWESMAMQYSSVNCDSRISDCNNKAANWNEQIELTSADGARFKVSDYPDVSEMPKLEDEDATSPIGVKATYDEEYNITACNFYSLAGVNLSLVNESSNVTLFGSKMSPKERIAAMKAKQYDIPLTYLLTTDRDGNIINSK